MLTLIGFDIYKTLYKTYVYRFFGKWSRERYPNRFQTIPEAIPQKPDPSHLPMLEPQLTNPISVCKESSQLVETMACLQVGVG